MTEKMLKDSPIHYWVNDTNAGNGLVFLHPAFGNHACFDAQLNDFQDYRIITPDIIGHGKSLGKGAITDTASHIKKIMETEKLTQIHLVGVSVGAVLAQDFADQYPDSVLSLACIGGYDIHHFDQASQKENQRAQIKMMLKAMFSKKAFAQANKSIGAYTNNAQEKFYQMNLEFKKSSFRYFASLGKLVNQRETQERAYPLFIGVGEHDNELAKKTARLWHESEPASVLTEFPGAGHIVNMDVPKQFNQALKQFIDAV